jgi:hypothetical protein
VITGTRSFGDSTIPCKLWRYFEYDSKMKRELQLHFDRMITSITFSLCMAMILCCIHCLHNVSRKSELSRLSLVVLRIAPFKRSKRWKKDISGSIKISSINSLLLIF